MFPASFSLAFISPPILLGETSKGTACDWIKTTKRKGIVIHDWTSGDRRGHLKNKKRSFNNFFVMQSSGIASIIAEQSVVSLRFLAGMKKHIDCLLID